jgi:hypothetical protein
LVIVFARRWFGWKELGPSAVLFERAKRWMGREAKRALNVMVALVVIKVVFTHLEASLSHSCPPPTTPILPLPDG